jgi:hypothetical protein
VCSSSIVARCRNACNLLAASKPRMYDLCMSSDVSDYTPPAGYRLVPETAHYTKTIAFRVTAEQYEQLNQLRETLQPATWGSTLRFLLNSKTVNALIASWLVAHQDDAE